jgi:hypothetical protein
MNYNNIQDWVELEFQTYTEVPDYLEVEMSYCDTELYGTMYLFYN